MLSLDDRPGPPQLPHFSRDMEQFLLAAVGPEVSGRPAAAARYRRHAAAGLAAATLAAAAAAGIGYAASGGHSPAASPSTSQSGGVHIHLAAFSVDTNPGGKVTLKLTQGQIFDPSALRHALAKAGVPALVTVGTVCTVPGPSSALTQVISQSAPSGGHTITIITPAAIPAGHKLSIGYFTVPGGGGVHIGLVPDNAPLTCTSTPPAPPRHGNGPAR